jgi:hypothetical protein
MSSGSDMLAAAGCKDNHEAYRLLAELEAESAYGFQGNRWLADVAPQLLGDDLIERIKGAKQIHVEREAIESQIPKHLLYEKGWPNVIPTNAEAELLATVRRRVSELTGIAVKHLDGNSVIARYEELMAAKLAKEKAARSKRKSKASDMPA